MAKAKYCGFKIQLWVFFFFFFNCGPYLTPVFNPSPPPVKELLLHAHPDYPSDSLRVILSDLNSTATEYIAQAE